MSDAARYAKTEAGRSEIRTRARKLSGSLRSLLLVIDGQRDDEQLAQVAAGLHAPADALPQLVALGLIERSASGTAAPAAPLAASANRYGVLYALLSDAVAEHLGLRGYFTQLRIEKCADAAELARLLPDLRAALAKAKGEPFADEWAQRMNSLAGL